MTQEAQGTARPASVEDLKLLLGALHDNGVEYLLIGGYALYALGYQRGTVDIDIVVQPTLEQGEKVRHALLMLPKSTPPSGLERLRALKVFSMTASEPQMLGRFSMYSGKKLSLINCWDAPGEHWWSQSRVAFA